MTVNKGPKMLVSIDDLRVVVQRPLEIPDDFDGPEHVYEVVLSTHKEPVVWAVGDHLTAMALQVRKEIMTTFNRLRRGQPLIVEMPIGCYVVSSLFRKPEVVR